MANNKCKSCGSTEIDIDPARGDAVCTSCGSVLEDSVIVSEIQFEENAHGGNSAIGHFVSSESHGGASSFGSNFHAGLGRESREITLSNAKRAITNVAQQLRLNQHCIDTAHNFYKMALIRNLTKGRKNTHVVAACLYITCRVEGTPHLLIDFSDVLQICVYELGRTYLRLSQALCINIPSMDPCLYILRFAHRLEFGDKTHEVSMTALRLVQRMKRDFIHTGRRPSGLCGAALLMAARLHEFNRTVGDIVKIVKVHESTLRKRLLEFGETPSSALTLEEFMTVDLEEEQDPPSFKAARKKDKDRLQRMMEEVSYATKFNELQHEIETLLDTKKLGMKRKKDRILGDDEEQEAETFILESTLGVIGGCLEDDSIPSQKEECSKGLGPDIASMGLATAMEQAPSADTATTSTQDSINEDIDLAGLDEDEIDSYIMTESEAKYKDSLWNKVNAEYLKEQKEKEERLAKEKEEGKPEKKKRRSKKTVKTAGIASTPGEAIEKMLQTKRISSKINYDVLRSLTAKDSESSRKEGPARSLPEGLKLEPRQNSILGPSRVSSRTAVSLSRLAAANKRAVHTLPSASTLSHCIKSDRAHGANSAKSALAEAEGEPCSELVAESQLEEEPEEEEEEEEEEPDTSEMSLAEMLNQHRDDDMYGGDYDDDY